LLAVELLASFLFSTLFASVVLWIVRGATFRHASFAHERRGSVYSICVLQLILRPFAPRERFQTCSTLYFRLTILWQKLYFLTFTFKQYKENQCFR